MDAMLWEWDTMLPMNALPFPPPPELGWCDDDATIVSDSPIETGESAENLDAGATLCEPMSEVAPTLQQPTVDGAWSSSKPETNDEGDIEDWDGTVLSASFMSEKPKKRYRLHNDATGQDIVLGTSVLLGRSASATVPEGAISIKLADPTRTVSRNHAALSYDKDGVLWIEDYGSLNGTYIIDGDREIRIKDRPIQLVSPATLRIGDQFFALTEEG